MVIKECTELTLTCFQTVSRLIDYTTCQHNSQYIPCNSFSLSSNDFVDTKMQCNSPLSFLGSPTNEAETRNDKMNFLLLNMFKKVK